MMEKQNRTIEKGAAGDAGALDDIVDFASRKMSRVHKTDPKSRKNKGDGLYTEAVPAEPAR